MELELVFDIQLKIFNKHIINTLNLFKKLENLDYIHYDITKRLINNKEKLIDFISKSEHSSIDTTNTDNIIINIDESNCIERSIILGIDYVNSKILSEKPNIEEITNSKIYIPSSIFTKYNDLNIVFCSYNEEFKWDSNFYTTFNKLYYYRKGTKEMITNFNTQYRDSNISVIPIENQGMEISTFLYYIINNYHNLADRTLFLRGQIQNDVIENKSFTPKDLVTRNLPFTASKSILSYKDVREYFYNLEEFVDSGFLGKKLEFEEFVYEYLEINSIPDNLIVLDSYNFLIHKQFLYSKPIEFYIRLYEFLKYDNNPIERIYMRFLFCTMFQ